MLVCLCYKSTNMPRSSPYRLAKNRCSEDRTRVSDVHAIFTCSVQMACAYELPSKAEMHASRATALLGSRQEVSHHEELSLCIDKN